MSDVGGSSPLAPVGGSWSLFWGCIRTKHYRINTINHPVKVLPKIIESLKRIKQQWWRNCARMLWDFSGIILEANGEPHHEFPQGQQGGVSLPLVATPAENFPSYKNFAEPELHDNPHTSIPRWRCYWIPWLNIPKVTKLMQVTDT